MAPTRMLFTTRPLAGHFEPLVPLAVEARRAGHSVAFATGEPYTSRARHAGFDAFHAGPDEGFRAEWAPQFPGFDQLVGDAQRRFFLTEIFANLELVPRAEDLEAIVDTWRPQIIVHEVAEFAAPLVGTAHGIPYADVSYGSLIGSSLLRATGEAAAPHWRARGLEPHPVAGLFRHLYVDTCPPALQSPEIASIDRRAADCDQPPPSVPSVAPPEWLDRLDSAAIVYLTMGTVWNRNLDIFRLVIEAVRDEDIALVVTVGRQNDPASLGPQPDNVVVHRYIPQGELLPRCHAVITHGGAGTTLGALAFGLPAAGPSAGSRPVRQRRARRRRRRRAAAPQETSCRSRPSETPCAPSSTTRATGAPLNVSRPRSTRCPTRATRSGGSRRSLGIEPEMITARTYDGLRCRNSAR